VVGLPVQQAGYSLLSGGVMKYYNIGKSTQIPALGLGTWKSPKGEVGKAVDEALQIGYRHVDCAPIYMNEKEVGDALAAALVGNVVKRDDLWVTSKLWNNAHQKKHVQPALEKTLRDLRLDYLDLFLIHWPVHVKPGIMHARNAEDYLRPEDIPIAETWQAMEKLVNKGLCRFIGVCNFNKRRLQELLSVAKIPPAMNQIELHPYLQQSAMLEFCKTNGIMLTAYSPLGSGDRPAVLKRPDEPVLLSHPTIQAVAEKHGCSPAQVLLAWGLARDTVVIPKSTNPQRLAENLAAADLQLDNDDLTAIGKLDQGYRYVHGSFFQSPGSPYTTRDIWGE